MTTIPTPASISKPPCILILGATSEIGGEIATRLARNMHVILASRRPDDLKDLTRTLLHAGAKSVESPLFDATNYPSHEALIADITSRYTLTHAVISFGVLGSQPDAEQSWQHAVDIATVDYTAQIVALTTLSNALIKQNSPATITVFSSIAGWRARKANYVYGSTKAGLDAFCQGLADRLHPTHVRMIIARPGFVIGNMTQGMTPAPLSVTAPDVANAVVTELLNGHKSTTLWIPRRLQKLAWVMRLVPRAIWRKMPR